MLFVKLETAKSVLFYEKEQLHTIKHTMILKNFIINLINTLLDGSFERVNIIRQMNSAFKEYFLSGEFDRLCKVSISKGRPDFAHEMSSFSFRSGFKLLIENDNNLKESEINEISEYILSNVAFVRQLMSLGFDTFIIKGKDVPVGKVFALKEYADLKNYFLK